MDNDNQDFDIMAKKIIWDALSGLKYCYAPYSGFKVSAALLTRAGKVYTGCNIENAALSPGICAERTAFAKAISSGEKEFEAIAIVGGMKGRGTQLCFPCGVCRQFMYEFCEPEKFKVIIATSAEKYDVYTLDELLPNGFGPGTLAGK